MDARLALPESLIGKPEVVKSVIFVTGYWDGFLAGVVEVEGNRYWADCVQEEFFPDDLGEEAGDRVRRFAVYDLTPEQWECLDENIELFERFVGTNCSKTKPRMLHPQGMWKNYYDSDTAKKMKGMLPELAKNPIVGWFEG